MNAQLTNIQIEWAKQHDWFASCRQGDRPVLFVYDRYTTSDGEYFEDLIRWDGSFEQLRLWAGY